uniref:FLYWCH-type domain-containing protein n=1 Tax=Heterorhabditis bacteriophora TaxID=37862 RepID=A0A1I7XLM5_HETBA
MIYGSCTRMKGCLIIGYIYMTFDTNTEDATDPKKSCCIWWTSGELRKKQPALVNRKTVLFIQDNDQPHVKKKTYNKIVEF